jgi:hypothetical protein
MRRSAGQFAMVLAVAALLLTQNRSAWAGAVVSLLVLGGLAARYATGTRSLLRHKHQILVPMLVIIGAIGLFFALSGQFGTFLARASTLTSGGSDKTLDWRFEMWRPAWAMFLQRPLAGWGLGSFPLFASYMGAPSQPVLAGQMPSMSEMVHNQYLQVAAETGIVGLLLYLGLFASFFVRCGRALKASGSHTRKWILMGAMASMAGIAVDAVFNASWQFADVGLFFWLVLGIGVAASRPRVEREQDEAVEAPASVPVRRPVPARVGWVMAQAAFLGVAIFITGQAYSANGQIGTGANGTTTNSGGIGAQAPPPVGYTTVINCRVQPTTVTTRVPNIGAAPNCFNLQFFVTFDTPSGPQEVDVTDQPETTFVISDPTCIRADSIGRFCVDDTAPDACQGTVQTITFTWNAGATPDQTCTAAATVNILFGRGTAGGGGGGGEEGGGGSAGIIIGAIAGVGLLSLLLFGHKHKKHGDGGDDGGDGGESKGEGKVSLPKYNRVTSIRTTPTALVVKPGPKGSEPQELKVFVQLDNQSQWYEVTDREETKLEFLNGAARLAGTIGNADHYLISRDRMTKQPLKVKATFHGPNNELSTETPVTFLAP